MADVDEWLAAQAASARSAMLRTDLRGHDPYDALLSPLFRLPVLRSSWAPRFAAQQVVLRSPVDLRRILRVPSQLNPVTVALYLDGLVDLSVSGQVDFDDASREASHWVEALETLSEPGYSGPCWGYPFPWEGRRHRMPKGTPTVVATSIVVNALHRTWRCFGTDRARGLTRASARFVLNDLPRSPGSGESFCWAYSPVDDQKILNATIKGSRLVMQALDAGLDGSEGAQARIAAESSARFVVDGQAEDGGWPYAVGRDPRNWRDHHHTGYVLDCLEYLVHSCEMGEFETSLQKGWNYYIRNFFTPDGLPKYFDDREGAIDATAAGQALLTLCRFGEVEFASRVARTVTGLLGRRDGTFAYRSGRSSRHHFIRWSTAWMFAGLCRVLLARQGATS